MATLAYTPTVAEVADHVRARTRGPAGDELGTFTDETHPTDDQVDRIIDRVQPFITGKLGTITAGSPCEEGARTLWALKAAEMIEISYFPEQLAPGGTVAALRNLFADLLPAVEACISGGGEGGGDDGDNTPPSSCFWDEDDYNGERTPSTGWGVTFVDGRDPVEVVVRVIET